MPSAMPRSTIASRASTDWWTEVVRIERAAVAEVHELERVQRDVARRALELEGLDAPVRRRLAVEHAAERELQSRSPGPMFT